MSRTAFVGYALGASAFHAPFIDAEPRLELAVVVTSDRRRREEGRSKYPEVVVLASIDELWDRAEGLDLIVVSTPNETHLRLAEAALRQGSHMVVDKPVAASPVGFDNSSMWQPRSFVVWCHFRTGDLMATF